MISILLREFAVLGGPKGHSLGNPYSACIDAYLRRVSNAAHLAGRFVDALKYRTACGIHRHEIAMLKACTFCVHICRRHMHAAALRML